MVEYQNTKERIFFKNENVDSFDGHKDLYFLKIRV